MPDAITLDLGLSDIDGWVLFDLLRHDPKTHAIPIHVISGAERTEVLNEKGAANVLTKPVSPDDLSRVFAEIKSSRLRTKRNLLVVDADADRRLTLVDTLRDGVTTVTALAAIPANSDDATLGNYDAVVLALGRSSKENARIIGELSATFGPVTSRVIIYSPAGVSLQPLLANNGLDLAVVDNPAQLASLISVRLPNPDAPDQPVPGQDAPDITDLAGAKVLIVDDDIRNIYSLTSVLETYGIDVVHAERGRQGISILEQEPGIDVALIDIMMPEMDGYETMREIRRRPQFAELPLISVTAKAMKGDRQKCLEAGASDYIAKPVDLDLLLALLRVWVGRSRGRPATRGGERTVGAAE
jgi:CheY-like chemotaxis protein